MLFYIYCNIFHVILFLFVSGGCKKRLSTSNIALFALFTFTLFSLTACSDNDDDDTSSALTSANVVEVVFSPSSFGDLGYNDIILTTVWISNQHRSTGTLCPRTSPTAPRRKPTSWQTCSTSVP